MTRTICKYCHGICVNSVWVVFHLYTYVKVGVNVYLSGSTVWSNDYINVYVCLDCHAICMSPMIMQWPADGINVPLNVYMCVWTNQEGLLAGALCEWGLLVSTAVKAYTTDIGVSHIFIQERQPYGLYKHKSPCGCMTPVEFVDHYDAVMINGLCYYLH